MSVVTEVVASVSNAGAGALAAALVSGAVIGGGIVAAVSPTQGEPHPAATAGFETPRDAAHGFVVERHAADPDFVYAGTHGPGNRAVQCPTAVDNCVGYYVATKTDEASKWAHVLYIVQADDGTWTVQGHDAAENVIL